MVGDKALANIKSGDDPLRSNAGTTEGRRKNDMPRNALYALPLIWLSTAAAIGDPHLKPGTWRETWQFKVQAVDGKPVAPDEDEEKPETSEECLDSTDVDDAQRFFGDYAAEHGCTNLKIMAKNGDIKIAGSCTFDNTNFSAVGKGRYDEKTYSEWVQLNGRIRGHLFTGSTTSIGKNLHDCIPEDEVKTRV